MFRIMAKYRGRAAEEIDSADTRKQAEYLRGEYALAFGGDFSIWIEEKS